MNARSRGVADIPDHALVSRAVWNAGHRRPAAPRWVHVQSAFALGSTFAQQLCEAHGCDPFEVVGVQEEEHRDE